jgi:PIN domain nuclease of toxin-antitoxin system
VNLLLDTHCLLWLLTDSPALDERARRAITGAETVWFSEASIWELGLKWRKSKIAMQPRRIAAQALGNGLRALSISIEALLVSSELRHAHDDPFDRLLYAQARVAGRKLLSMDRTLRSFGAVILRP